MMRIAWRLVGVAALCLAVVGHAESTFSVGVHYLQHPENNGSNGPSERNIPVWYPIDALDAQNASYTFGGAFPGATAILDAPLSKGGPFAAVVLSGGVAELPEAYYRFAEALARKGHVVVGVKPYFELFSQSEWRQDTANETLGFSYLVFLRQRALTQALNVLTTASNITSTDAILRGSVDFSRKFVAIGHYLGAAASLTLGGLNLKTCAPMPIDLGDEVARTYWSSAVLCQKYVSMANLSSQGPYSFADARFGAIIALDPPPQVRYILPEGAGKSSWFTSDSARQFSTPTLWLSVTGSVYSDNVLDSFDFLSRPEHRGIVMGRNLSSDAFLSECELAAYRNESVPSDCTGDALNLLNETQQLFSELSAQFAFSFSNCSKRIHTFDFDANVNVTFVAQAELIGIQGYSCYVSPASAPFVYTPYPHVKPLQDVPRGITYLHHPLNPQPIHLNSTSIRNIPVWYPQTRTDENRTPFTFNGLFPSATAVLDAAPSTSGPFPLAILIPDVLEYPESYYETAEMLAASRFVVVGVKPYYELFQQDQWGPLLKDDPLGFAYFTYIRPLSMERSLAAVLNATDGVRKHNVLRGLIDLTKPVVLIGHGLGAVTALAATGMTLVPCASQPFPLANGTVSKVWSNPDLCKMFLSAGGLPINQPLNVSRFSFGPVAALEPGSYLHYFDSVSSRNFSWFTDDSFNNYFQSPLAVLSMQGSGLEAQNSELGFSRFNATNSKAFMQFYNGTYDTFMSICELAAYDPARYGPDAIYCQGNSRPPISDLQHEAALYTTLFANLTVKCVRDKHWTEPAHHDLIVQKQIVGFDKLNCPPQDGGMSQLTIVLIICGSSAVVFIFIFAVALFVGHQQDKRKKKRLLNSGGGGGSGRSGRSSTHISRDMADVIEGGGGMESGDENESLLATSSSSAMASRISSSSSSH